MRCLSCSSRAVWIMAQVSTCFALAMGRNCRNCCFLNLHVNRFAYVAHSHFQIETRCKYYVFSDPCSRRCIHRQHYKSQFAVCKNCDLVGGFNSYLSLPTIVYHCSSQSLCSLVILTATYEWIWSFGGWSLGAWIRTCRPWWQPWSIASWTLSRSNPRGPC